jgi:N-acetylneuraminic acid mutarotase
MTSKRDSHTATLLPNGQVMVAAGYDYSGSGALSKTELYNPNNGKWTTNAAMSIARGDHSATMLANGKVLVVGGWNTSALSSTEVYDPTINPAMGTWTNTGAVNTSRSYHQATLLPDGKVLIAGGYRGNDASMSSAELYSAVDGTWTKTSPLNTPRRFYTLTLLPNGKVLALGGWDTSNSVLSSAELYDPIMGIWSMIGSMSTNRYGHTTTLLRNGKVLIAGGQSANFFTHSSAELYDPITETWTPTGDMNVRRTSHTATLLSNGKVLVAAGFNGDYLSSAELYDPATGIWTVTGGMTTPRDVHTATLLQDGRVLVAAGYNDIAGVPSYLSSAELFDPATGTWSVAGAMNFPREFPTATLLPNGKVLVAGGFSSNIFTISVTAELFDPLKEVWTTNLAMNTTRIGQTATLLPNAKVLMAGGGTGIATLYDVGLGFSNSWGPQITSLISPLNLGNSLVITGAQFRGVSESSSGNFQNSSSDYPLVQLRSIESGQTAFLLATNWSTNSFASTPVWNFPPGYALATVIVNGIPSTSSVINISVPVPTTTTLTDAQPLTNGLFQFAFTNNVDALLGVLATTNLAQPLTNWTALGGVMEIAPGQFQFTDLQATNFPERFYRVRSP